MDWNDSVEFDSSGMTGGTSWYSLEELYECFWKE